MLCTVVNTQTADLPFIYRLFDAAIMYQKRNGYPVWPDYDKAVLQQDVVDQRQFKVVSGDKIAGVFSVCYDDVVVWRERDQANAIYLHRIVVNPDFKGQKLFGKVLRWAEQHAVEKQRPLIRMDTWADNPIIIAYYQSFGFRIIDHFTTPDSEALPVQQRGNRVVLLEYEVQPLTSTARKIKISSAEALRQLADSDNRFATLFEHGTLSVEVYQPERTDDQQPHTRDEIYVIMAGQGEFYCNGDTITFASGDFLFVPAGAEHRFFNFSEDFATWVFFYGPEGGEQ